MEVARAVECHGVRDRSIFAESDAHRIAGREVQNGLERYRHIEQPGRIRVVPADVKIVRVSVRGIDEPDPQLALGCTGRHQDIPAEPEGVHPRSRRSERGRCEVPALVCRLDSERGDGLRSVERQSARGIRRDEPRPFRLVVRDEPVPRTERHGDDAIARCCGDVRSGRQDQTGAVVRQRQRPGKANDAPESGSDGAKSQEELDAEAASAAAAAQAASAASAGAGDMTAMLDRIQKLTSDLTKAQTDLTSMTAERDKLVTDVEAQKGHVVRLSGVAAQAINRMETALRGTATDDLDTLEPVALLTKYQSTRDKFEKTFPVGRKTTQAVDKALSGEQRPRQDTIAEAAQNATKI